MPERPSDPQLAAAVEMIRRESRRKFLIRSGMGAAALAFGPTFLAACGGGSSGGSDGASAGDGDTKLTISNWDAYIDEDADGNVKASGTTLGDFQKDTGIKVTLFVGGALEHDDGVGNSDKRLLEHILLLLRLYFALLREVCDALCIRAGDRFT